MKLVLFAVYFILSSPVCFRSFLSVFCHFVFLLQSLLSAHFELDKECLNPKVKLIEKNVQETVFSSGEQERVA